MDRVLFQATSDGKSAGDKILLIDGPEAVITATGAELTYTVPTAGTHGPCKVYVGAGQTCSEPRLKVTLVWTDPPANPLANNPLINNLNLVVEDQQGGLSHRPANADTDADAVEQAASLAALTSRPRALTPRSARSGVD